MKEIQTIVYVRGFELMALITHNHKSESLSPYIHIIGTILVLIIMTQSTRSDLLIQFHTKK